MLQIVTGMPGEETYSAAEASRILSRGGRSLTEDTGPPCPEAASSRPTHRILCFFVR